MVRAVDKANAIMRRYHADAFQRSIISEAIYHIPFITWKDKLRNEDIRNQTKLQRMDLIIKERRLRWLGHVLRMEDDRIPKQAT